MGDSLQSADSDSDGRPESSEVSELEGRLVDDRYRLEAHLGGGAMGEVYRAQHTLMQKTVAVKLLRPEVADDESVVERFRREAAAAGNLEHPNICAATDFGETDDGLLYLVMEYVDGRNLRDLLDERRMLPPADAAAIADGIAAALEKADELDIIHRDIKPDNVMLLAGERSPESVKVLDFGVAHVEFNDAMPSLTKTGVVFGTPTYMAPEQASGEQVEHRTDLYGLGAVLFEMLTGREVFSGEKSVHVMAAHIKNDPPVPSEIRNDGEIPAELDRLVLDLLSKEPEDRPESATEVRERLAPFSPSNQPAAARSSGAMRSDFGTLRPADTSSLSSAARTLRRWTNGLDFGALGPLHLVLLGLVGVLGTALVGLVVGDRAGSPSTASAEASDSQEPAETESRDRKPSPELRAATEALAEGRPAEAVEQLEALRERRGEPISPRADFLLGRSRQELGDKRKALDAYRRASRKNAEYLSQRKVLDLFTEALTSEEPELRKSARRFVRAFHDDSAVQNRVATVAWRHESEETRQRAHEMLTTHDLIGEIPKWQRLSIELRRADDCDGYEKYVDAIIELGDPRAVGILKIYEDKPRQGCSVPNFPLLKTRDCYRCIREELDEGIELLEKKD